MNPTRRRAKRKSQSEQGGAFYAYGKLAFTFASAAPRYQSSGLTVPLRDAPNPDTYAHQQPDSQQPCRVGFWYDWSGYETGVAVIGESD